jgi:hypothetical protein
MQMNVCDALEIIAVSPAGSDELVEPKTHGSFDCGSAYF